MLLNDLSLFVSTDTTWNLFKKLLCLYPMITPITCSFGAEERPTNLLKLAGTFCYREDFCSYFARHSVGCRRFLRISIYAPLFFAPPPLFAAGMAREIRASVASRVRKIAAPIRHLVPAERSNALNNQAISGASFGDPTQ
ncbi:MAG: hypothetical protein JWO91_3335 [Acidobacteriaceae bacterium]|jgi:hypothetical protein|nr:hypothetical protein [Acidobacteriaceae bacterium]